jgi:type VI secretion system protein ImpH
MENLGKLIKSLSNHLRQGKYAPDFWGLVRLLENSKPDLPRLGHGKLPAEENIRFGQVPYLNFPSTDIAEIFEGKIPGVDATVITYFFGLLGVNGPMPLEFTHYVFQRSHNQYDHTWRRFLDIIHHRMLIFYYRAFAMHQQSICFDRPQEDPITNSIKSLAGLPLDMGYDAAQSKITLAFAHHFGFIKNRASLEDILRRLFGFKLEVNEFSPVVYDIPSDSYAVLGNPKTTSLGVNLQIGRTYYSVTQRFEICIGPIDFNAYQVFMSGLSGFELLVQTVKLYLTRPLDYHIEFKLLSSSIPGARLGFDWEQDFDAAQLGYSCWIGRLQEEQVSLTIDASRINRKKHSASFKMEATT